MIRTVTFTVLRPDGEPWAGGVVKFRLAPGSFTAADQYPADLVTVTLDDEGAGTADLWANEDGETESAYTCTLPSGERFEFTLPPGDGSDIALSVLRIAGVINTDWTEELVTTFITTHPDLRGPTGDTGPEGPQGDTGPQGAAATIAVGTVTTGAPGSSASVANSGTSAAAVLDFTIPRGDVGATGDTGPQGDPGEAATIAVGTVTTGAPGSDAEVTNSGTPQAAVLDFTIPQGPQGEQGAQGVQGETGPAGAANDTYDVSTYIPGRPLASEVILRFVAVRAVTLPASLTGSRLSAEAAATAQSVFSVKKNGTEIGTLTVAASGTTATAASASGASFAAGDLLTVVAPASQDATLAGVSVTLKGATA